MRSITRIFIATLVITSSISFGVARAQNSQSVATAIKARTPLIVALPLENQPAEPLIVRATPRDTDVVVVSSKTTAAQLLKAVLILHQAHSAAAPNEKAVAYRVRSLNQAERDEKYPNAELERAQRILDNVATAKPKMMRHIGKAKSITIYIPKKKHTFMKPRKDSGQ